VRERRKLQRTLLAIDPGPLGSGGLVALVGELVGSWSYDIALPADAAAVEAMPPTDRDLLCDAVREEIPYLQMAVHPAPGWRQQPT
jgi:hypothetical protein